MVGNGELEMNKIKLIEKSEFNYFFEIYKNNIQNFNSDLPNMLCCLGIKYLPNKLKNVICIVKFSKDFQSSFVKSLGLYKYCTKEKNKLGFFPKQYNHNQNKNFLRFSYYCLNTNNGKKCPMGNILLAIFFLFSKNTCY